MLICSSGACSDADSTPVTFTAAERTKGWKALMSLGDMRSKFLDDKKQLKVTITIFCLVSSKLMHSCRNQCWA